MAKRKRLNPVDTQGIDKLLAYIANTPGVQHEDLMRKSLELGYSPDELIDKALGSVLYDKSKANLDKPLVDILNDVYEKNITPGERYVLEPYEARSKKAKEIAQSLGSDYGIAIPDDTMGARVNPKSHTVREAYDDMSKLQQIASGGHELKHGEDWLIRPHFDSEGTAYKKGHHYGDVYETSELLKQAKDLPDDSKVIAEIAKRSSAANLKPSYFKKLFSVLAPVVAKSLPVVGAAAGLSAMKDAYSKGDYGRALAEGVSMVDPTPITDLGMLAYDLYQDKKEPEEQPKFTKIRELNRR